MVKLQRLLCIPVTSNFRFAMRYISLSCDYILRAHCSDYANLVSFVPLCGSYRSNIDVSTT